MTLIKRSVNYGKFINYEDRYILCFELFDIPTKYFSQSKSKSRGFKIPLLSTKMMFKEDFELKYKELWNEISQRISDDNKIDVKIFYEEKDLFYQRLFVIDADTLMDFNETYKTFEVWWNSFAGRFSIERSIDEMGQKLYWDLANLLVQKRIKLQKELNISLI